MRQVDDWVEVLPAVLQLADAMHTSRFVPHEMRGNRGDCVGLLLLARELGLQPLAGMQAVTSVAGTPTLKAAALRGLVLRSGGEIEVLESGAERCRMRGRRDGGEWVTAVYTMAEARASGDAGRNREYGKRPVEMLLARCTSRLIRVAFPDVAMGVLTEEEARSVSDELGAHVEALGGGSEPVGGAAEEFSLAEAAEGPGEAAEGPGEAAEGPGEAAEGPGEAAEELFSL